MENFFFGTKYIWKNRVVKDYVRKKLQTPIRVMHKIEKPTAEHHIVHDQDEAVRRLF